MPTANLDAIQRKLAEYCAELLHAPHVTADDNFLDLGGDSLSAMIFISRVHKEFHVQLTIEDFFIEPGTLGSLAGIVQELMAQPRDSAPTPPIEPVQS